MSKLEEKNGLDVKSAVVGVGVGPLPAIPEGTPANARLMLKDLMSVNLDEVDKELNERVTVQHIDPHVKKPVFNAFSKNVAVKDDNGKFIIIDNHDELRRIKLKNAGKLGAKVTNVEVAPNATEDDDDIEFDD
jgi:hypothetical protein